MALQQGPMGNRAGRGAGWEGDGQLLAPFPFQAVAITTVSLLWDLSCSTSTAEDWPGASLCGSALLSTSKMQHVCAAVTIMAASRPTRCFQIHQILILPSPRCSQPPAPFPYSAGPAFVPFLYAEIHSQVARAHFCLASKGTVFLSVTGSCFPLSCPPYSTWEVRDWHPLLLPFQIFHFPGSLSNTQGAQVCIPEEGFLFCFPVAVPTSIAAVMAHPSAVETLLLLTLVCVCVVVFAHSCALGKIHVCTTHTGSVERYLAVQQQESLFAGGCVRTKCL